VNRSGAALLLLLVLVSGPLALLLPGDIGSIRLGGVSLLWWYEGLVAPVAAAAAAIRWLPAPPEMPPAE
jgi:hypothetical protein